MQRENVDGRKILEAGVGRDDGGDARPGPENVRSRGSVLVGAEDLPRQVVTCREYDNRTVLCAHGTGGRTVCEATLIRGGNQ